jgi:hypothetical protein
MVDLTAMDPKQAKQLILAGKARAPLRVDGTLDLSNQSGLKKLPKGLSCFELNLTGCSIVELPDDIQVESSLILRNCENLKRLPDGLAVESLDLQGCSALSQLPEGLDVWFLNLRGCVSFSQFPEKASIRNGSLLVGGCRKLTSLPAYLKKLSTLDVSDCPQIDTLPPKLEVGLWIDVGGSGITKLSAPNHEVGVRWRGVAIDHRIAFQPESITSAEVLKQKNTELRRVLIERMGNERFVSQAKAKVIDRDRDAGGPRELLRLLLENDEDFVCLSCNCPSTSRHYLLRVPPNMETCHQAAAWMAGFDDPTKYKPVIET